MLERLNEMFAGRTVLITHTNEGIKSLEGVCQSVLPMPEAAPDQYKIVLVGGRTFWFFPEEVNGSWVDGRLPGTAGGRRKIEIVQ